VSLYTQWLPAFESLLAQEGGDLPRFYARVERLAALPADQRAAALEAAMPPARAQQRELPAPH
jgi:predicted aminopeptidase